MEKDVESICQSSTNNGGQSIGQSSIDNAGQNIGQSSTDNGRQSIGLSDNGGQSIGQSDNGGQDIGQSSIDNAGQSIGQSGNSGQSIGQSSIDNAGQSIGQSDNGGESIGQSSIDNAGQSNGLSDNGGQSIGQSDNGGQSIGQSSIDDAGQSIGQYSIENFTGQSISQKAELKPECEEYQSVVDGLSYRYGSERSEETDGICDIGINELEKVSNIIACDNTNINNNKREDNIRDNNNKDNSVVDIENDNSENNKNSTDKCDLRAPNDGIGNSVSLNQNLTVGHNTAPDSLETGIMTHTSLSRDVMREVSDTCHWKMSNEDGKMKNGDGKMKNGKMKNEDGKAMHEDGKTKNEDGKAKAEDEKAKTEDGKNEDWKNKSEDGKTENEDGKMMNEDAKMKNEDWKAKTQDGKAKNEDVKTKNEDAKAKNEDGKMKNGKAKNEDEKTKTEDGKTKNEDGKIINEDANTKNEDGKAKTEDGKIKTEDAKAETEDGKSMNEKTEDTETSKVTHDSVSDDDENEVKGARISINPFYIECEACLDKQDAFWRCLKCNGNLCGKCYRDHRKIKIFSNHPIIPIERVDNCRKHMGRRKCIHCDVCDQELCGRCILQDHEGHPYTASLETNFRNAYEESFLNNTGMANLAKMDVQVEITEAQIDIVRDEIKESRKNIVDIYNKASSSVEAMYYNAIEKLEQKARSNTDTYVPDYVALERQRDTIEEIIEDCRIKMCQPDLSALEVIKILEIDIPNIEKYILN